MLCDSSLTLGISFSLTFQPPLTLAVAETTSRPSPRPAGRKYFVLAAFDLTVTSHADANRLVWTKPHVRLMSFNISNNHPINFMSHVDTIPLLECKAVIRAMSAQHNV